MRGGFLDVAERHPSVERGGDERMPQGVPPDRLGDSGADRDPADDRAAPCRPSRLTATGRAVSRLVAGN